DKAKQQKKREEEAKEISKKYIKRLLGNIDEEIRDSQPEETYSVDLSCDGIPDALDGDITDFVRNDIGLPQIVVADDLVKILKKRGFEVRFTSPYYKPGAIIILSEIVRRAMNIWREGGTYYPRDSKVTIEVQLYPAGLADKINAELKVNQEKEEESIEKPSQMTESAAKKKKKRTQAPASTVAKKAPTRKRKQK